MIKLRHLPAACKAAFFALLFVTGLILAVFFHPAAMKSASAETIITDEAHLFAEEQLSDLRSTGNSISETYQVDFHIMTRETLDGEYFMYYMERYADDNEIEDAILILISMEPGNRIYEIEGYGQTQNFLTDSRCIKILDLMEYDMRAGNYYNAVNKALNRCNLYLGKESSPIADTVMESPFFKSWVQLILCICLAAIIVGVWVYNSGGKMTVHGKDYLNEGNSRILARHDHYIRTTVSKRVKPSESSGGGRGGSGVSRGGRSHSGGGGRRF